MLSPNGSILKMQARLPRCMAMLFHWPKQNPVSWSRVVLYQYLCQVLVDFNVNIKMASNIVRFSLDVVA